MQKAIQRCVNFTLPCDDMPIDISFVFENEAPAGKHGFLTTKGDKFVFEDGTEARFWGTNFNSAANFPSHEYSEIVARRLAKTGLNIVRFHQLDGDWSTPNIFAFTKGKRLNDTRHLDPQSMDRLDYLIYALKKNGIYVYMDNITYRRFRSGDGLDLVKGLGDGGRPAANFNRRMIELQKEFMEQLWNHCNPYTKLAYKDDPAIVMTEIANESDVFGRPKGFKGVYAEEFENLYQSWRREHGLEPVSSPMTDFSSSNEEIVRFKIELQKAYYDEMYAYMRKLGIRIPICGTNWAEGGVPLLKSMVDLNFTDAHAYHNAWKFKLNNKEFSNYSFISSQLCWLDKLSFPRMPDRPYFISEWDEPWPNEFRAEGPLALAARCAYQGWSGAAIHTYRYDCRLNVDMIAAPITGEAISGVSFRAGVFDSFNDPCRYGLFYHAALMLRRGDVKESTKQAVLYLEKNMASGYKQEVKADSNPAGYANIYMAHYVNSATADSAAHFVHIPAIPYSGELSRIGIAVPGTKIPEGAEMLDPLRPRLPENTTRIVSDTGELIRDMAKKIYLIDSPRTKVAAGFLNAAGTQELQGVKVTCRNEFAVIAMSSLTDAPITGSDNILLTAVGNCDNTGAAYNYQHTVLFDKGRGPIEAEVICADIEIDNARGEFRVDAINDHGLQVGQATCVAKDGKLKFSIGTEFASVYYLIQKL